MTTYLFIDGRHLRKHYQETVQQWFGSEGEIDFRQIKGGFLGGGIARCFSYHALADEQQQGESEQDFVARLEREEAVFNGIEDLDGYSVRLGSITGLKRNRRQKKVDNAQTAKNSFLLITAAGRRVQKYMFTEVFDWLPKSTHIEQIAVFYNHPVGRDTIALSAALNLKGDLALHWVSESTAMAVIDTAALEKVDATLLAVTWAAESGFGEHPTNNPRKNKKGKEIGADIGPMQLANTIYNKSPFTDNLGDVFGSDQKGGQRFNGTPAANLRAGARALNYALGLSKTGDRAEAAGFFRAGPNRNSAFESRVRQFNTWASTYDKFFNCLKGAR